MCRSNLRKGLHSLNKEFINFKEAKQLKRLRFNENCFGYYENQNEKLILNFSNLNLTEEQKKRPKLYEIDNRNSILPQWATAAPTYQQAFKWFRKKHNKHCYIHYHSKPSYSIVVYDDIDMYNSLSKKITYNTYEEAELECLLELIKKVKQKK